MRLLTLLSVVLLIAGCGSREVLLPFAVQPAVDVSFAGFWQLNEDPADIARRLNRAIRDTADIRVDVIQPNPADRRNRRGRVRTRTRGGLAHVFLETGNSLKITQTPTALFISFDRAVVEEFRFGEQRDISLGQVEAQRVSGWQGTEYVVETLGPNGTKLTERYRLAGETRTLIREIVLRSKGSDEATVVETYSRRG